MYNEDVASRRIKFVDTRSSNAVGATLVAAPTERSLAGKIPMIREADTFVVHCQLSIEIKGESFICLS